MPLKELKSTYATSVSKFISVHGMDVHYRDEGVMTDSLPIVLIHGTGASLHTFEDWAIQLKQNRRVIRMDLPAYGLTGPFPNRDYSINNYVHFLVKFLDSLGIQKCILGGNSLGGHIAWETAYKYPKMVDKLILIDAAGYPSKPKSTPLAFQVAQIPLIKNAFKLITPRWVVKQSIENVYADKTKITETLVDRYFELALRKGNRQAFIDRFRVTHDTLSHKNIKLIEQKTLVLWGEEDLLIPVEIAYKFHDDMPNTTLAIMSNVGHVPMEENPTKSLEALLSFLKD